MILCSLKNLGYWLCNDVPRSTRRSRCRTVSERMLDHNKHIPTRSRYPTDNCFARYGYGTYHDAQQEFANYMSHTSAQDTVKSYLNSGMLAQSLNKPLMMFETNTASCGGFPGIADAFGAALWGLDYALQLAYSNFSVAMFHSSGQNVSYNVCACCFDLIYCRSTDIDPALHATSNCRELLPPMDSGAHILLRPRLCRDPQQF